MQVRHPSDHLPFILRVDPQFLEYFRICPSFRWRPFARRPIIDVPVRLVHELVQLGQLSGVHHAEVLLRKRAEQEVALERAALAALVHEARPRRFDGLARTRQRFGGWYVGRRCGGGDVFRGVRHWPGIFPSHSA